MEALTKEQAYNNLAQAIEMANKAGLFTLGESVALFNSLLKVKNDLKVKDTEGEKQ